MTRRQRTVEREQDDEKAREERINTYAARYGVLKSLEPHLDQKKGHENSIFDEVLDVEKGKCAFPGCEKRKLKKTKDGKDSRWCHGHRKQWERGTGMRPLKVFSKDPACSTPGCPNERMKDKHGHFKGPHCGSCRWQVRKAKREAN